MNTSWTEKWDQRYSQPEFAYGTAPNAFFKEQIGQLPAGQLLCAAEGEGRNAVYAATLGWQVAAFDISQEARKKANTLAAQHKVSIDYKVGHLPDLDFAEASFDCIALIYAHFPPPLKASFHAHLAKLLKPGGHIIFEAFGQGHLAYRQANPKVGGPDKLEALFSVQELQDQFKSFKVKQLEEVEVTLNEGLYHNGTGAAVRFVAQKPYAFML